MQQQTVGNDSGFLKYLWTHLAIFNDGFWCNAIWGLKGHAHSTEVSCLALHRLRFLWIPWIFSQYYVWYLVKDLNSLQFCIAKCDFDLFATSLMKFGSDEPWSSFACKDCTPLLLLYQNMIPWAITNSPAYCELFQNSLTWIFYNLFTFILPLSKRFWSVLQPSKTKCVHIYKIHLQWSVKTLEIFSLYFCQLNKSLRELTNHRFLTFMHFTKCPNFSGIGVVYPIIKKYFISDAIYIILYDIILYYIISLDLGECSNCLKHWSNNTAMLWKPPTTRKHCGNKFSTSKLYSYFLQKQKR